MFKEDFILCYIDDILVFSKDVKEHIIHLQKFYDLVYNNGLVLFATKMEVAQINVKYLGMDIENERVKVQKHIFETIFKFLDKLIEKTQLQRFLRCVNYVYGYFPFLAAKRKLLNKRFFKNPLEWSKEMIATVKRIKQVSQSLLALRLPSSR